LEGCCDLNDFQARLTKSARVRGFEPKPIIRRVRRPESAPERREVAPSSCLTLGIGLIGALFVLWVISRGVVPTIGDLFKTAVLFVTLIAIAVRRQRELCVRVQIYLQREGQSHDVFGRAAPAR
jgi:hypothetical protein